MSYSEITQELDKLSAWGRAAFAWGCAERVASVPSRLKQPEAAALFRSGLDAVFGRLAGHATGGEADAVAAEVAEFIEESGTEESFDPPSFALEALAVVAYALDAVGTEDDPRPAKWACSAALSVTGTVDNVLGEDWGRTVAISPRNPPPPGPLEAREMKAQQETLELLKSATRPAAELLDALRDSSREASRELDFALVEFCRRLNWECEPTR